MDITRAISSQRYTQTQGDLDEQFRHAKEAMELSWRSFDAGYEGEAKRLSAVIRLLVHDTSQSKSLLGQLGDKGPPVCRHLS